MSVKDWLVHVNKTRMEHHIADDDGKLNPKTLNLNPKPLTLNPKP